MCSLTPNCAESLILFAELKPRSAAHISDAIKQLVSFVFSQVIIRKKLLHSAVELRRIFARKMATL